MPFRLIERTIIFDLLKFTVMGVIGASALLMVLGAMIEAARHGMDPISVLMVMPYLIAPTLPYTMPTCLLLACTVVYGGMSTANEITALKAGGIHVFRALWPAVMLSIAMAFFGVYMGDQIIPACNRKLTEAILADIEGTMYSYLKEKGELREAGFPYELYVQSVHDQKLINPIIKHRNQRSNGYDMVAQASAATLKVVSGENENQLELQIRLVDGVLTTGAENTVRFHDRTEKMPVPPFFKKSDEKTESLSFLRLKEKSTTLRNEARELDMTLMQLGTVSSLTGNMRHLANELKWNRHHCERFDRKARESDAEVHLRIAQSMAAIPFVLLGCPLSILFQKREFLRTFFVCFLPIVTIYYPAMILCFNVFKEGQGGSAATLWAPSLVMALVAIPFLRRVVRY